MKVCLYFSVCRRSQAKYFRDLLHMGKFLCRFCKFAYAIQNKHLFFCCILVSQEKVALGANGVLISVLSRAQGFSFLIAGMKNLKLQL